MGVLGLEGVNQLIKRDTIWSSAHLCNLALYE